MSCIYKFLRYQKGSIEPKVCNQFNYVDDAAMHVVIVIVLGSIEIPFCFRMIIKDLFEALPIF